MEDAKRIAEVALGIVLATTPLTLWIAWTATLVLCVMLVSLLCAALLALLVESAPVGRTDGSGNAPLPPEFIEEVQQLYPLTYHHSRHETQRFRQAMQRLAAYAGIRRS
jgi:hypothetical protein